MSKQALKDIRKLRRDLLDTQQHARKWQRVNPELTSGLLDLMDIIRSRLEEIEITIYRECDK